MKTIIKFKSIESFSTVRLNAKKVDANDLDKFIAMNADPRVMTTLGGVRNIEQSKKDLERHLSRWKESGFGSWIFYLKDTDEWIGRAGLRRLVVADNEEVEIGYALIPRFWNQGYAIEMATAIAEIAFEVVRLDNIVCFTEKTNIASQQVMQKAGFQYERDFEYESVQHVLYRMKNPIQKDHMNNAHIKWARCVLEDKDYQVQSHTPDVIQDNPWAVVYRFKTNQGNVFLKRVPSKLLLEPKVINLLRSEFHANIPIIIAESREQNCFLMKDAGIQLHHYFKQHFNMDILIKTMQAYTKLQISATNKTQLFLDLGVPDWGLEKLPILYRDFINQEVLLIEDGLNNDDLIKLNKLESKLSYLCESLAGYKIKDTFGHADFHDKNILINPDTGQTTIIDLGEVVVTHPFFSFLNCLYRAKENFALTENQYHQLQLACFEPWLELESQKNLFDILSIINQCWPIHGVLGEYRLMKSVNKADFQKLHRRGRFSLTLRYWLDQWDNKGNSL